jgi:predicted nucleic acid-binding protein
VRVFLDANVLFSAALNPGTRAHDLLEMARSGGPALLTPAYAVEEAERNLLSKAAHALHRLPAVLRALTVVGPPPARLLAWAERQGLPAKDAPTLAAAVAARADLLLAGDRRHFGHLFGRTLESVTDLDLAEALRRLLGMAGTGRPEQRQNLS